MKERNYKYYSVLEIVDEITATKSRNEKIAIMEKAVKENREFKITLYYTYNPFILYGMKEFDMGTCNARWPDGNNLFQVCERHLQPIIDGRISGKKASQKITMLTDFMNEQDAEILKRIVARDLRAGINVSSINKACPGLIPTYDVSLCSPFNEDDVRKMNYPVIAQHKEDAMRVHVHVSRSGNVTARSRNGKHKPLPEVFKKAITASGIADCVFDGELYVVDKTGQPLPRKISNGIINKCAKGNISDCEASRIRMAVWDLLPESVVQGKVPSWRYADRFSQVQQILGQQGTVHAVESVICNSYDEVLQYFERVAAMGKEGIVVKDMNALWKGKRTKDAIKIKVENECELRIVNILEGRGRLVGKLGAAMCESEDGLLSVDVGSGFSDGQREKYFTKDMIGKVITVKYSDVFRDVNGMYHLYCPIFLEVRDDKDTADTIDKILV